MVIMNAISIITRYSKVFFDRNLIDINVSFTEQFVIMYLCKNNSVNQDSIAKYFMIDKGAIAKTLNHLEDKKLILRTDNPSNKREKLISPTNEGKQILGFMNDKLLEWDSLLFEGLSEEEIESFKRITLKISDNATRVINRRSMSDEKSE